MCQDCSKSPQFLADGEIHQILEKAGQIWVDHLEVDKGKHDKVNLSENMGAETIADGVKAVRDYHAGIGPSYYD